MDLSSPKGTAALEVVRKLKNAGYETLFAGGCVRDHLLDSQPTDYDIATSATPDQVEKLFTKTIPVGKEFGVILVVVEGMQFEVATFRTEGGYQDGRRPGFVNFSNAKEDALRRDFTVNGVFYDPLTYKVIDYVGGEKDLHMKIIRCIGDPANRFEEDKLRLLRAIRFSARLGFKIEKMTWDEIIKRGNQISTVSKERILEELNKIVTSAHASEGFKLLTESGLLKALLPQINPVALSRFNSLNKRTLYTAYAALFAHLSKRERLDVLRDLRCSNDLIQTVTDILELEEKIQKFDSYRTGEMEKILNDKNYANAFAVFESDPTNNAKIVFMQKKLEQRQNKSLPVPLLSGQDLTGLGLQPGPKIGKILEEAYLQQLEGKFKNKAEALSWAKTQI